jgi:hypothetical protein
MPLMEYDTAFERAEEGGHRLAPIQSDQTHRPNAYFRALECPKIAMDKENAAAEAAAL